jgi:hypothetical protein
MTPTIKPTPKQHLAWQKLQDKTTRSVVFGGGAGGGKSFLGCEWILTNCFFYPGTRWFIGRDSLKSLRESTLISWYKVLRHHKIKHEGLFKYNGQDNFFLFTNGSRVDLVDLGWYPSDPFYERFGSMEFSGGWIEEAGEVSDLAAQMISSRIGRMYNDKYNLLGKVFMTCNPKKNFLYKDYYQPWKKGILPPDKAFIQSLHKDNIYGESGYEGVLQKLSGVARQRLLLGDWEYDEDANSLIEYEKILDIFKNNHINGGVHYITVDVARKGQDSTVIGLWSGFGVRFYQYEKLLTTEVTKKVKQLQEKYRISASNIIVDEDGVGGGVCDQLQCQGFVNNSRPLPNYSNPQLDQRGNIIVENFDNLKSQCYFRLADRINKGHLFVDCEEPEMIERIIQELEQVKQKDIDSDKKKGVVPKEEVKEILGRSPDFSDCLMMREYFELKPKFVVTAA